MAQSILVSTVVGARPQFVKAAVVSRAFSEFNQGQHDLEFRERIVHTGQHYDHGMSEVFFSELEIPQPHDNLNVGSGLHGFQTGLMMQKLEQLYQAEPPDLVLNYGDTNSTLASALVAAKLHIPVAHVEAGLRSFNRKMPEEINRVVTDHVAEWLFCPTPAAIANLRNEGVSRGVFEVGDVMYDCARIYGRISDANSTVLDKIGLDPGSYLLATVHRAENTDDYDSLSGITRALLAVASETLPIVLPLHPRTSKQLSNFGLLSELVDADAVRLTDPVGFLDMLALERHAKLILTDSGGVQKEAFFCKVPCVTLRYETEWVELVSSGWNELAGSSEEQIRNVSGEMLARFAKSPPEHSSNLFGDGHAAKRIVSTLAECWRTASDDGAS